MTILFSLLSFSCRDQASDENSADGNFLDQHDTASSTESEPETEGSIVVFAASDVGDSTIETTVEWLEKAQSLWYTEGTFGSENDLYSPIYLILVGDEMQATIELEEEYCDHLYEHHGESVEYSRCNTNYTDPNCEHGICLFTEYVTNGGAGIASSRQNDGYHLMIMAAKNPGPNEEDYKKVVFHEAFHIYQLSQHNELDYDKAEELTGRRSGDHDENVPWWSEGTAEYMAVYHYSQQDGVDENYFEREMRNKLGYFEGESEAYVINEYLEHDTKLYNITFDDNGHLAYHIGSWLVAYLVHTHGQQKILDFYQNIHLMNFEDNFTEHFDQDHRATIDEFEDFLFQEDKALLLEILR